MKKTVSIVAMITIMSFVSCNGSKTKQNDEKEEGVQKEEGIELVNYENSTMGFTILVPKKAKVLDDGEYAFTSSLVLDSMNEINVSVSPSFGEVNSIEELKSDLKNFMANNITKAEKTESGFLAVNEQGPIIKVFHRTDKLQVTITVTKEFQGIAEKIALSVKSTK